MKAPKRESREIELAPDAWERFERAVSVVAKSPPQHKVASKKSPAKHTAVKKSGRGK